MCSRHILLTGPPGVGKTTVIRKVCDELKNKKLKVDGFYTEEVRTDRVRVGFDIVTLTGKRDVLARVSEEVARTATSNEVASCLSNFKSSEKIMYRARSLVRPPLPVTKRDINLSESWKKTKNGEDFLLVDVGDEENRMLIFGTRENLHKLCISDRIFLDGTFKVVSKLFHQLYTKHGIYMGQVFPFIYALLPNKSQDSYQRLLLNLKIKAESFNLEFKPKFCLIDFELAAINALKLVFPDTTIKGCFFHYTQCIWRKVQQFGLVSNYKNNEQVRKWIQRITALPLVPKNLVSEAFLWLQEDAPDVSQTTEMYNYLVETWLDECMATFPTNIWNHFDNEHARTNNNVEGFHSKLSKRVCHPHPNLYSFIELIRTLQSENEGIMRMLLSGSATAPKTKTKYRRLNKKLIDLKNKFRSSSITLMSYVDAVGHLLHLEN